MKKKIRLIKPYLPGRNVMVEIRTSFSRGIKTYAESYKALVCDLLNAGIYDFLDPVTAENMPRTKQQWAKLLYDCPSFYSVTFYELDDDSGVFEEVRFKKV